MTNSRFRAWRAQEICSSVQGGSTSTTSCSPHSGGLAAVCRGSFDRQHRLRSVQRLGPSEVSDASESELLVLELRHQLREVKKDLEEAQ